MMKLNSRGGWLATGAAAYVVFLLITLPASLVVARLAKYGVISNATTGSVWHGQITGLQAGVLNLGNAEWRLRLLPLFTGKLAADIKLTQPDGFANARVAASFSGRIVLSDVSASLPLQSIVGRGGLPGGWVGKVQAKLANLEIKNGWPLAVQGTLDLIDVTGPANQPNNIGAYRVKFPADSASAEAITGTLESLEGAAIDVVGTLKLSADRSYQLDTMVAARGNAPPSLAQGMQYLGPPDAQGRRPFSVSGTM
jgi:general secretion pathway protein N